MLAAAQIRPVATAFLRLRPIIVAPFFAFTIAVLALTGARHEQLVGLGCVGTLANAFFFYERRRGEKKLVDAATFGRSLIGTVLALAFACTATGGIESPFVPMLFAPTGIAFAAFGRTKRSIVLFGVLALVIGGLVVLAPFASELAVPPIGRRIVLGAAVLCATTLLFAGVATLSAAHARAADTLVIAGEEMVHASQARAKEMQLLGARVAHEVKNPLAAIRALVEVMLESADERSKKRLSVAAQEVARIERIVEGYSASVWERSEAATHPLDTTTRDEVDVGDMVGTLVSVLEARAERSGVTLRVASNDAVRFSLDRDRVREALLNLVLNALDATKAGGEVTIAWQLADDELVLEVKDTGIGIDAATLPKIGMPFFTLRPGGTGLGAAHARRVAEQHGGRLDWTSTKGRGTTARLRLSSNGDRTPL